MSAPVLFPALVIFLHDLFTVLWIGGILFMALVMMPAMRTARTAGGGPAGGAQVPLATLMNTVQSRLAVVSIVSLVGLVVTGILLTRRSAAGALLRFDTAYAAVLSVKRLLMIVLVVASLLRRRLSASGGRAAAVLLAVNAVLGVAILFLSALNAAMA